MTKKESELLNNILDNGIKECLGNAPTTDTKYEYITTLYRLRQAVEQCGITEESSSLPRDILRLKDFITNEYNQNTFSDEELDNMEQVLDWLKELERLREGVPQLVLLDPDGKEVSISKAFPNSRVLLDVVDTGSLVELRSDGGIYKPWVDYTVKVKIR